MIFSFDPNCTPTKYIVSSSQNWKAGVLGDSCYADANSSEYTLTIKGDLINSIFEPMWNVFEDSENVTFVGNITSDCQDETIIDATATFYATHESSNYNGVPNPAQNNGTEYNATWDATEGPEGNYSVTMNSTKSLYNNNGTTINNLFHHQRNPQLPNSEVYVTPASAQWGTNFTFYYMLTDDNQNAADYLWRKCTGGSHLI